MESCIKRAEIQYNKIKSILKDLYEENNRADEWPDAEKDFASHMLNLFFCIATSHDPISDEEVTFIENFFVLDNVRNILSDKVANIQRANMFLTHIPVYLNEVINMDGYKAKTIVNMISEVLMELASVDMNYSEKESKFITFFSNRMTNAVPKVADFKNFLAEHKKTEVKAPTEKVEEKGPEKLEDILAELEELIGLGEIKLEVSTLVNMTKINNLRKERGLKNVPISRHMVFTGSPGTGKTTIARIISRLYKALGVLSKGHLIETDRSGLVAGYIGQTAGNVKKVVESAIGGVLFIDEAYSLTYSNDSADFGKEAIDALVKLMEDNRENLVVIVAGYENEMKDFINSNPGLASRFSKYIKFKDYTADELFDIFMLLVNKNMFMLSRDAIDEIKRFLEVKGKVEGFGNGRGVRNCFEKLLEIQANRIVSIQSITDEELQMITKEDVLKLTSEEGNS